MDTIESNKPSNNSENSLNTAVQAKTGNSPNFQTDSDDNKKDDKNKLPESDGNKTDEKKPPQFSKLDKLIGYIGFALIMMAFLPFLGAVAGFPIPDFIPKVPLEVGYGLGIPMAGFSAYKFVKYKNDQINQNQVAPDNISQSQQNEKGKNPVIELQLGQDIQDRSGRKDSIGEGVNDELKSKLSGIAQRVASGNPQTGGNEQSGTISSSRRFDKASSR